VYVSPPPIVTKWLKLTIMFLQFAYGSTKAALEHITKTMAADLAHRKVPIRINAIEPGAFPSDIVAPEIFEEYKTKPLPGFIAPVPLLRWGK